MTGMILTIIGLLIGICIAVGGGVYLKKEWADKEFRKVYGIFSRLALPLQLV
jgi:ABC-type phosphate transport system permease subunit